MKKVKIIFITSMITIVLTAVLCWFINQRTLAAFCDALVYVAIAYLVIGGASLMGSLNFRSSFGYQYVRTASGQKGANRPIDDYNTEAKSFSFLLACACIFAILMGLSWLIKYIFV